MGNETFAELKAALVNKRHLADAAARRIRFLAPKTIRGAMIEAKAAVDAARVVLILRLIGGGKAAERERELALEFFVRMWDL